MQIKVQNNSLVVISSISIADYSQAKQYTPDALRIKDDKGNDLYTISTGDASIKKFGATFNAVVDNRLAITTPLPMGATAEEASDIIQHHYALGLASLAKYEDTIGIQIESALEPVLAVMNSVTFE
jgi:hypothetical protein